VITFKDCDRYDKDTDLKTHNSRTVMEFRLTHTEIDLEHVG